MSATSATDRMTADEFFRWINLPENRDLHVELERGVVIEMPPPGKFHGFVCGNIAGILRDYAIRRGRGYVCTNDAGLIVERDPDTVRGPDVTFYDDNQTADTMDRQFAERPPELAVEVMSPNDRLNRTLLRISQMLDLGVRMVWVVDPETRDVSVYRPGQAHCLVAADQELNGDDALPEFRCLVSQFFQLPGRDVSPRPSMPGSGS